MLRAVIFDMDGLMIDTEIVNYYAFRDFFRTLGVELSKEDYYTHITGKSVENAFESMRRTVHIEFTMMDAFAYLEKTNKQRISHTILLNL